jgi:hypothetical protein
MGMGWENQAWCPESLAMAGFYAFATGCVLHRALSQFSTRLPPPRPAPPGPPRGPCFASYTGLLSVAVELTGAALGWRGGAGAAGVGTE